MFWKRPTKSGAILAALLAFPVYAIQPVILAVPDDDSAIDIKPAAEMLIRNGAHATLEVLPSGRINSVMRDEAPACRPEVVREPDMHSDLQWVVRTASIDYVVAGLAEEAVRSPGAHRIAVVALNTKAQIVATKAGYDSLPVKSLSAAIPLLQSGRASVLIAARPEVDNLAAAKGVPLHVEAVLAHADTWLACNTHVGAEDMRLIRDAWRQALSSGELRAFYDKAGLSSVYPGP